MALLSKNKLKFVDGSIRAPPVTDPLYPAWERCKTMVGSWLTKSLSSTIAHSILWLDKAYDIWDDLKDRLAQHDMLRISDLQEEIFGLKQGDLSVSDYFTKLKILWDEFTSLRPIKECVCVPSSSCEASKNAKIYREQDYVIRFLKGLNDRYATVKSQIM